jgi:LysR family hydrogen peroxide-inducible transcriptional activator
MNFNQLKYILAVDTFRNFARAAEHCGIAQSTMSKEIQRLEAEFGILLFDRSRHPVVPTMKGRDLLKQAKRIVGEEEKFRAMAHKRDNAAEGEFSLGILPGLAPYLLPLFLPGVEKKYPLLSLTISELGLKEMEESLRREELDGGIVIAPFFKEGYYETALFQESFVLYLGPDHPLAARAQVAWAEVPVEELILHEDLNTLVEQKSKHKKITWNSGSPETIRKLIDRGGGITLLPETAMLYMGERRQKMVRKLAPPVVRRTISLVTARGFEKNRLVKALVREMKEGFAGRAARP